MKTVEVRKLLPSVPAGQHPLTQIHVLHQVSHCDSAWEHTHYACNLLGVLTGLQHAFSPVHLASFTKRNREAEAETEFYKLRHTEAGWQNV